MAIALFTLALTPQTWRVAQGVDHPPMDRPIKVTANIVDRDEFSSSVEPYEGFARWSDEAQDWLNEAGLSIRGYYEAELVILGWQEGNPERRFLLLRRFRGEDDVKRLAPIRPRTQLPAPAWMSEPEHPHNKRLYDLTDAELEYRHRQVGQYITYLLHGRSHLWSDFYRGSLQVEAVYETLIVNRWLRDRDKKREQAILRRDKKARAAA